MPGLRKTEPKVRLHADLARHTAAKIHQHRIACGMSLPVAAVALGVSLPTLIRYEAGANIPQVELLFEMALLFDVPISELIPHIEREKIYEYGFIKRDANISKEETPDRGAGVPTPSSAVDGGQSEDGSVDFSFD